MIASNTMHDTVFHLIDVSSPSSSSSLRWSQAALYVLQYVDPHYFLYRIIHFPPVKSLLRSL